MNLKEKLTDIRSKIAQAHQAAKESTYFELDHLRTPVLEICNQITSLPKSEAEEMLPLLVDIIQAIDQTVGDIRQVGALHKNEME